MSSVEDNLAEQRRLYGEPLGDVVRRLMTAFSMTQGRTAQVLGLSPAMLSQLMSGQRVKIANPLVAGRLSALLDLAGTAGEMADDLVRTEVDRIAASSTPSATTRTAGDSAGPELLHRVIRAVASGRSVVAAAELLRADHPELAELLRVYGVGDAGEMRAHFASLKPLL